MYRTGDLVCWGADGQLRYLGAPMSRSRSAGIASNWVRSKRLGEVVGVDQAVVIAREDRPAD